MKCSYCRRWYLPDRAGNCPSCGANAPSSHERLKRFVVKDGVVQENPYYHYQCVAPGLMSVIAL
jgi:hypothetical protein